ncbi:MAG: ABC transporter permease subunit [Acidimicrobiales bacterium]
MEQLFGYAVPGIPNGCSFAIVAVGLVLTYQATGVFNFAFGAQAYASAFVMAWLVQDHGLPVWAAFLLAVVVMAPALGLAFDRFLFSKIPNTNNMAKVVTGLCLLVGIPAVLPVIFGGNNFFNPPQILFGPNVYFTLAGAPITGTILDAVIVTVVVLVLLVGLLRFTSLGLQMRGAVESRRLVQLEGVNAGGVVSVAWMVSSLLAGLAGVLLAPSSHEVSSQAFITLTVAAIAAAAVGVLRSMPVAAVAGVAMGVVETAVQGYLPTTGGWSVIEAAVVPSFPFIVLVVALLVVPGLRTLEDAKDPLASVDPPPPPTTAASRAPQMDRVIRVLWYVVLAGFVASMLSWIPPQWEVPFNQGLAFSVLFLSITLITGMAGQLSLAQATLAGVGAFTAAQLAHHFGLSMLLGGLVGAALAAAVAVVLAVMSLRLKGLGLALMTLAAALFFDNSVFVQKSIGGGTAGFGLQRSWTAPFNLFTSDGHSYFILVMAVLVVVALGTFLLQRGTVGRYLGAMRGSETGAASLGINLTWQRVMIFALSGAVAGIGGTLVAIQQQVANPVSFNYQYSLAFVVVVITTGVTTIEGAIQAGMSFALIQYVLSVYAPLQLSNLTFVLFAFGALTYTTHPEGVLEYQKRTWTLRVQGWVFKQDGSPPSRGMAIAGGHGPGAMLGTQISEASQASQASKATGATGATGPAGRDRG